MLKSFRQLAAEPGAPLKSQPENARDVVAWLQQAQVKLQDARQAIVSPGTRMDAAWDAVLLSSLAVACAEGWRATSDRGHHAVASKVLHRPLAWARRASIPWTHCATGATASTAPGS
jgi:hypothetical protein